MRLQVEQVSFGYGAAQVLREVSVEVQPGKVLGLIGPNGSGKTTLLRLAAGVLQPSQGRILLDGRPLASFRGSERARTIALVEQHAATGLDLTVRAVIELGRIPYRGRWPVRAGEGEDAIRTGAELANVTHLQARRWQTLSGGERQRVQLARAIAQQPDVLLLDEPTNHLDLGHQIDFLERVRGLGVTTVAALHDLELAIAFCDRLVVLDHGEVADAGVPNQVLTPGLLRQVSGIDADMVPHPRLPRPHLVWSGTVGRTAP